MLTPTQQTIYEMVRERPRSPQDLMDAIYWIHPQDAPKRSCLKAHVWHLNRRIKLLGEVVRGSWGGSRENRDSLYQLRKIGDDVPR